MDTYEDTDARSLDLYNASRVEAHKPVEVTVKVNGETLAMVELCGTRFVPGDDVYPDETLYVVQTNKGSYLVPATAFSVNPETLKVTGNLFNWS